MTTALYALLVLGPSQIYVPKPGSKERKAIMEGLRAVVGPSVKQAVVFDTDWIRSNGDWAFLKGKPRRPDGRSLDYSKTQYQGSIRAGAFDDGFTAIMHRKGMRWSAVEWTIGATDVPWDGAWRRLTLPRGLFPK